MSTFLFERGLNDHVYVLVCYTLTLVAIVRAIAYSYSPCNAATFPCVPVSDTLYIPGP